jgi:hypothetical protein
MAYLFANDAKTVLAGSITNVAVSLNVAAGTGALFPNPSAPDLFVITLKDAATGLIKEIMHCTARSGDTLTVVRAQEGTTALPWLAGDVVAQLWTAGQAAYIATLNNANQQQSANYGVDTGTADALVVALTPAPVALSDLLGAPVRILKIASPNATTTPTVAISGLGATVIEHADGSALAVGELPTSGLFEIMYNGSVFILMSRTNGAATAAEMETMTDTLRQVTPANFLYHPLALKGWAGFHWSGAAVVVADSQNVGAIARTGTGIYTVQMNDGLNYSFGYIAVNSHGVNPGSAGSMGMGTSFSGVNALVTIHFGDSGGSGGQASDPSDAFIQIYGRTS